VLFRSNDNSEKIFSIEKDIDYVRIGTLYYKWSGSVNIGGGQLTLYGKDGINIELDNWKRCSLSTNDNNFNIKNTNNNKEITIPYGTDLTNYNKPTFFQSIINHTIINNPLNTLKEIITNNERFSTTIKTLVGEDIYPKTTHTLLTVYYTSYLKTLPQITDTVRKQLLYYYCTNENFRAIQISVINSTSYTSPRMFIEIYHLNGYRYKEYIITVDERKVVIDLTADLAAARSENEEEQKIVSAQFLLSTYGVDSETYSKDCINILSNFFFSYTYED
jgi:hypothetical protein